MRFFRIWLSYRLFRAANRLNPDIMRSLIRTTINALIEDKP